MGYCVMDDVFKSKNLVVVPWGLAAGRDACSERFSPMAGEFLTQLGNVKNSTPLPCTYPSYLIELLGMVLCDARTNTYYLGEV